MLKTYFRLLSFARPLSRYTIPYFIFAALHALFNTFNYAMIIPILNAMFGSEGGFKFAPCYTLPELSFNEAGFNAILSYCYTMLFGENFSVSKFLLLLGLNRKSQICKNI